MTKCVNELARGVLGEESENFIRTMARPINCVEHEESLKIFSTNLLADAYNREKILEIPATLFSFESEDSGEEKCLQEILAPAALWLKKGARVILLRHISDELVNGLRDYVTEIQQE